MINVKLKTTLTGSDEEFNLAFTSQLVSVKEIIEYSVREQVLFKSNLRAVQNVSHPNVPDIEKQTYVTLTAFQRQEYFMIVDGKHVTELDERVRLRRNSEIKFFRLTPLVGG